MEQKIVEEMYGIVDKYALENGLNELMKSFIADKRNEGSRWSSITRCTHDMFGGASPLIDRSAALTELIMLSFDIIDDLQDQDNTGKPWMTCPNEFTLNGILLFVISFMTELGRIQEQLPHSKASLLTEAGVILSSSINGQQIDLNDSIASEADYIAMIKQKSGSLLRFACFMGYSLVPNLDQCTVEKMNELGECIGMISQLDNDMGDVIRFDEKNDLLQRKRTLPVLFLLAESEREFPPLTQYYKGELSQEQFISYKEQCMKYIESSGCLEYCRVIQSIYMNHANELFESLAAVSPGKERFRELTFGRRLKKLGRQHLES
jgi:competence protein ComQ